MNSDKTALVVGSTGIVGYSLVKELIQGGWNVIGVARRPVQDQPGMVSIPADLLDREALRTALKDVRPTHLFFATWSRHTTEAENIHVNGTMMQNLLDVVRPKESLQHFALVTGLKHFIGPFEMYAKLSPPMTPIKESLPRLDIPNFYYTLEDAVFEAADKDGFGWSVHRPHTMIGFAHANVMNMGSTLAAYASIARETNRPFAFPGTTVQWNGVTDVTDGRMLAKHLVWASTTPAARNQALHVVNGDVFRWKEMWPRLAAWFEVEAAPFEGDGIPLKTQMADAGPVWQAMASKYGLVQPALDRLASFWHTDADLRRPFEILTDMTKSREFGFTQYQSTERSFFDLFEQLRRNKYVP